MEQNNQKITSAYQEYSHALFKYCFFKVSDKEIANDLVQETFTRTWHYIVKGNDIENVRPFLYSTARHLIVDQYRKKKVVSLENLMAEGFEPSIHTEQRLYTTVDASRLMDSVEQLPKLYSVIILMRYRNDLSIKDIALSINKSENVVSVRIHRGLEKLKMLLTV